MALAVALSRAQDGINTQLVTVEVHLGKGLPSLSIVGLPETAVKESKERVRAALANNYFKFPARRITINLAPADIPKEGSRFDLAIALGMLAASNQLPGNALEGYEFIGELALSGKLRPIQGVLPSAIHAAESNRILILPKENVAEATLVSTARIIGADHLLAVCAHLRGEQILPIEHYAPSPNSHSDELNLNDVHGQQHAKRALEVAAAGGHNILLIGPPGSGKSMLALRLPGILPTMSEKEALESAAVLSVSHHSFTSTQWRKRPFRSPHHTASAVALVGGGSNPRPGEISLAHKGILFLDELAEFDRRVLDVLREPLESGHITISRASRQIDYPAEFQLIAAMNPCPCGYLGDIKSECRCTPDQIKRYRARISGPLLDRIDLHVEVPRLPRAQLHSSEESKIESSYAVRQRVTIARNVQTNRCGKYNTALSNKEIKQYCQLNSADRTLLENALDKFNLSARAYHRILKVARSIADLGNCDKIKTKHLSEAISYRRLDRNIIGME